MHARSATIAAACAALAVLAAPAGLPAASEASVASVASEASEASAASRCPLPHFGPGASYHPHFFAGRFTARVTNPWFPMRPGTTWIYSGRQDGQRSVDIVTASRRTRVIDGVRTRISYDRLLLGGVLRERTSDYFAQDRCGNVWYFGEDTAELNARGQVTSREGSFHAGVAGGQPGVIMQRHPQLHRRFRQEWSSGQAEDVFSAVSRHAVARVPRGTFRHALRTRETSRLEPGVVDGKFYARGIGEVAEFTVRGPAEPLRLISVLH
jgi:hypothetical protein